jgi:predicted ATP-grasp superfamily ATP-dependent carboligase
MDDAVNYRIYQQPETEDATLLVCWTQDAGGIGNGVFKYLYDRLHCTMFAEIEPGEFFPLRGVTVENDIASFPESRFYKCSEANLIIFKSSIPRFEWYRFIETVLEVAQEICQVKEIYTVGGMVSISAHTLPRILMATMNTAEFKTSLCDFDINLSLDYESPPGQRPTMSSYLIWEAMRRDIAGISLWVPVPFYMVSVTDLRSCRRMVDFLDRKLGMGMDFSSIDKSLGEQNYAILQATEAFPEIMDTIRKLETNSAVSEEESDKLVEIMEEYLK